MKNFLSLLLIFTVSVCFAQNSPASLQWEKKQNGFGQTANQFLKAKIDASGNIYSLFDSDYDMLVVKYNSSTQIEKRYRFNNYHNAFDAPSDFEIDDVGNVYICGSSYTGLYTISFVKYNQSGTKLFESHIRMNQNYQPIVVNAMCTDNNGGMVFTGKSGDSLIVGRINASGAFDWVAHPSHNNIYFGEGMEVKMDGFNSINVSGRIKNVNGDMDAVVMKFNSSGQLLWSRTTAGLAGVDDISVDLGIDNSSNIITLSNIADASTTNYSVALTKYNASGSQLWQKKINNIGQQNSQGVKLIVDNIGNSYCGISISEGSGNGYSKIYKYSMSGFMSYEATLDDAGQNYTKLTDFINDQNYNIYAAGIYEGTETAFYSKINSAGFSVFFNSCNYCGASGFINKVGITAEQNGSFNLLAHGTAYKTYNARFSNGGVFQFDNLTSDASNTYDNAFNVYANGNNGAYALGFLGNEVTNGDAVVSKFDGQGNILWQNIIDNNGLQDQPYFMAKDEDYNLYVSLFSAGTGQVQKIDSSGLPIWSYDSPRLYQRVSIGSGQTVYLGGSNISGGINFNVAKLASNGSMLFENIVSVDSDNKLYPYDMKVFNNDQILICGKRLYHEGQADETNYGLLECYSSTGVLLWVKDMPLAAPGFLTNDFYHGTGFRKILVDGNNNVYVMGNGISVSQQSYTFIYKYDSNGALVWSKIMDATDTFSSWEVGNDIAFLLDGSLILKSGLDGLKFRRINPTDGSIIWSRKFDNIYYYTEDVSLNSLKIDQSGNILYIASSQSNVSRGGVIVLGKLDPAGNSLWQQHRDNPVRSNDHAISMDLSSDESRIYVSGRLSNSFSEFQDYGVMKFCDIPQPILSVSGPTQNLCSGSTVNLNASGGTNYLWNDNTTNTSLIAATTGNYYCTTFQSDGCNKTTDTVHVQYKTPPVAPQICLVTVDSSSTHNIIVWDKTAITDASAFNIYREDATNSYSYIGTVVYDSLSEFHDYGADPNVTTKRYKISSMDACGQESDLSNYHNTIYIVDNGNGQFSWNPLYTIQNSPNPVNNYILMRDDNNTGNWVQVQSTAGTQNTIVDPLYASFPNANWRVETAWNISCESTMRLSGTNETQTMIVKSKSNIKNQRTTGLSSVNQEVFSVSPNPATNTLNINFVKFELNKKTSIEIVDELGRLIIQVDGKQQNTIDVSTINPGVYFINVLQDNQKSTRKFVKM